MANIAQDQLTTTGGLYTGPSTLVYSVGSYNMDNSTGWITSPTFGSPFLWDGSSNLLVEVCYSYSKPVIIGTYGGAQYTPDAGVGAPNHMATLLAYGPCANPSGTVTTFYTSRLTNIRLTVTSANVCAGNPAIGNVSSGLQCPNSSTDIDVSGLGWTGIYLSMVAV
ncbi:MAG: hypothetical protein IPP77_05155 [Bacteroidetes bacterium]|nr:hypothetical protein [Bacteroidota bacterium]